MEALIKASQADDYPARIDLVISNRPQAGGIAKAKALGVKAIAIDHKDYETRQAFEAQMQAALIEHKIEFVCCAGFMRVLTESFTSQWQDRMINIHPSLLPKYKGLNTHARAIEAGDTVHGATVHYVTADLDSGSIIHQARILITPKDTPKSLETKVRAQEHNLYTSALMTALRGRKISSK